MGGKPHSRPEIDASAFGLLRRPLSSMPSLAWSLLLAAIFIQKVTAGFHIDAACAQTPKAQKSILSSLVADVSAELDLELTFLQTPTVPHYSVDVLLKHVDVWLQRCVLVV